MKNILFCAQIDLKMFKNYSSASSLIKTLITLNFHLSILNTRPKSHLDSFHEKYNLVWEKSLSFHIKN